MFSQHDAGKHEREAGYFSAITQKSWSVFRHWLLGVIKSINSYSTSLKYSFFCNILTNLHLNYIEERYVFWIKARREWPALSVQRTQSATDKKIKPLNLRLPLDFSYFILFIILQHFITCKNRQHGDITLCIYFLGIFCRRYCPFTTRR